MICNKNQINQNLFLDDGFYNLKIHKYAILRSK